MGAEQRVKRAQTREQQPPLMPAEFIHKLMLHLYLELIHKDKESMDFVKINFPGVFAKLSPSPS